MNRSTAALLLSLITTLSFSILSSPTWANSSKPKAPKRRINTTTASKQDVKKPSPAKEQKKNSGPTASDMLKKSDEARMPDGTISFNVRVEDKNGTEVTGDTTYHVFAKGEDRAMIETTQPARLKGRKLLMRGDDLWLYLPTVKRPTRVGLQQRLTGEVANGDVARTRFFSDYTPQKLGEEIIGGKTTQKLELKAKKKETTYRRALLWVETATFQPVKAEFFAISGKLLKRSEYFDYKTILGGTRATRVLIRDALKPTKTSELFYSEFSREELDDSFFTKESLM